MLRIGKMKIQAFRQKSNYHGKNRATIFGPTFSWVRLSVHSPSTGHRFIFYTPTGSWWALDVYFDRRPKVEEIHAG